jgi:P63C domain
MATTAAEQIIDKFGNQTKLALALGTRQSTVSHWRQTGDIPKRWHAKILVAAHERELSISPDNLINTPVSDVAPLIPSAIASADMVVGDEENAPSIACYVLSDGRRIISRTSALSAIARANDLTLGGDLKRYVKPAAAYLRVDLNEELVEFRLDNVSNKKVAGITAECFLEICRAFVRARDVGKLTPRQQQMAVNAGAFLAACANVGLIALIDEATGYQYMRAEDALRVKLRAYLEEEMRPWEKTFPDELWVEFGRLTGWHGSVQQRPKYWGTLVNELVYSLLDPDVAEWLRSNAPPPRHGQNYHQWLSSNYGLKRLVEHIWMLVGMASACGTMDELRYRMGNKFGKQNFQFRMFIDPPGLDGVDDSGSVAPSRLELSLAQRES